MFLALLICSDESCTHELEAWGALDELEALAATAAALCSS
jgi:hypothetical protein